MLSRFFYHLKREFGFSRKESKGFVVVVPLLAILAFSPIAFEKVRNSNATESDENLDYVIDSLEKAGFTVVESPFPIQVPVDTLVSPGSGLKKIPFSQADSVTLQIVPGIGPSLAGRIIKYEHALGGFYTKSQIKDVFGLKPEVADRIWEYFDFDGEIRNRVPINTVTIEELAKHPYVSYGQAKVLIAYRNQHGNFSAAEDLLEIKIFEEDWVEKLKPYLTF
ncbi:MAG: helix-hairpin-helix domain-containing protein [Algoriphagus sp.]|uniref:ComEA family DNA-binding protein n=1 Tax=Algoriphagus sp. TaxID=1872435 RepID=UPI00182DB421|nr:helix-hairpin-helix domain-containing protein [Algoriphagus sp.]NVJ85695.1 helix-hairpin-helix domain-containing protein [Algoriphagus sp.]